ncbi:MAG TPA: ABC transporter permease [Chitinophaga sp.]|uniref:ABC transporter permease n=1 Tax=Chitinophaga sp. TaxID=1869181 RepID=UPI002BE003A8|nr:ABC transporter permease [Chitinophaga sp.]HVI47739.1 ABC transporter permease [Chitinophaga sp.]
MFRNYVKMALRHLWKNKGYSFLNIFGLMIGIACAGVIFLWVEDELNYNGSHEKKDQLHVVVQNWNYSGNIRTFWSTPGPMGPVIKAGIPGVANFCRANEDPFPMLFTDGDTKVYASGLYADSTIFSMFTLPIAEGNRSTIFTDPHSLVVTQKTARKFFGTDKNVVGRTLTVDNKDVYTVTAVLKEPAENNTIRFEWLAPFPTYLQANPWLNEWGNNSIHTFIELTPGANVAAVNEKMAAAVAKMTRGEIATPLLLSMNDWQLHSHFEDGKQTGGRIEYVRLFSLIAWIIVFIACINFMNLATARSEKRAKEVGVRKVMGAGKGRLMLQFAGEALVMSAIAALLAVLLITLILPAFNAMVGKHIGLGLGQPSHWTAIVLIILICGLIAGSYPSLYLSSFNPVSVLKGLKLKAGSATYIRKGLVVVQFTVSIVLIISTIIIYQQLQHVKHRNIGYNKDNLLMLDMQGNMARNFDAIREDLLATGVVANVAYASHPVIYDGNNTDAFRWDQQPAEKVLVSYRIISPAFMKTFGLEVLEGRDFSQVAASDSMSIVITASMAKMMGSGSAIGKTVRSPGGPNGSFNTFTVVGVVNDYVYGNMYGKPDPVIFLCSGRDASVMFVRIKTGSDPERALAKIGAVMGKVNPQYPFSYKFTDDEFNAMFNNEMLMGRLSRLFAVLTVVISCLGLFGLAAYTAERRTREIGIRKVLGASVSGIAGLLSKDFIQLVVLSAVIAFPLAWWLMSGWLQRYSYRVSIQWWVFVLAGVMAIVIALLTVSFQAMKAALMNPVKSLRAE